MLELILSKSRYLALLTVTITLASSTLLFVFTSISTVTSLTTAFMQFDLDSGLLKSLAISMLKLVDLFFIATGLQIISAGTYKLFINNNVKLPKVMDVQTFAELKLSVIRIGAIILLIIFLEKVVADDPGQSVLEYGLGIAAIIIAYGYFTKSQQKPRQKNPHQH